MKKYAILLVCLVTLFATQAVFAYAPTSTEVQRTQALTQKLTDIIDGDKLTLWHFYTQLLDIDEYFVNDPRMHYMITTIANNLDQQLETMKIPALLDSKIQKEAFVAQYASWILVEHDIPQKCRERWQYLDDISFVHDFPTAITISTWYTESTCGFYLPINKLYGSNGPFQIITKDYGTGEMTEKLFRQTVEDFIGFSQAKFSSYAKANRDQWLTVNLTYTDFNYTGVVRHGALYNGLSGSTIKGNIQPMKSWYVFNSYAPEYSGAVRYGLLPMFIKSLQWELANVYPKLVGTVGVY